MNFISFQPSTLTVTISFTEIKWIKQNTIYKTSHAFHINEVLNKNKKKKIFWKLKLVSITGSRRNGCNRERERERAVVIETKKLLNNIFGKKRQISIVLTFNISTPDALLTYWKSNIVSSY